MSTSIAENQTVVPIGITNGAFSVGPAGTATYAHPILVPPGIGEKDNTPHLSLNYNQSNSNGVLGQGWALQGLSSISWLPLNPALGFQGQPTEYAPGRTLLALDGNYMMLDHGEYAKQDSTYRLELDTNRTIQFTDRGAGLGFVVTDPSGRTIEYGTTTDSRQLSADKAAVTSWKICKSIDIHGNCLTYSYTHAPRKTDGTTLQATTNVIYTDAISYTSNHTGGNSLSASRFVNFFYTTRSDPVVSTGIGEILRMEYILASISVDISVNGADFNVRKYDLTYTYSNFSGAAQLISIQHIGADGSSLPPTIFSYTSGADPSVWFSASRQPVPLAIDTFSVESIVPLNISGKALPDLAVLARPKEDLNRPFLNIITYLASFTSSGKDDSKSIQWQRSGVSSSLPAFARNTTPKFMFGDLSGDGTSDIVMAYSPNSGGTSSLPLSISISPCTGTGFGTPIIIPTNYRWIENDQFFAFDSTGNGRSDIVQVTTVGSQVVVRTWTVDSSGNGNLIPRQTADIAIGPITQVTEQWFHADLTRNGLQDLVRVWYILQGSTRMYYATTYTASVDANTNSPAFQESSRSFLGEVNGPPGQYNVHVVPIDFNVDGLTDLVICKVQQTTGSAVGLSCDFKLFLSDGAGAFKLQQQKTNTKVVYQRVQVTDLSLRTMALTASGAPSIVLSYKNQDGRQTALTIRGNHSAQIPEFEEQEILSSTDNIGRNMSITPTDVNGSGQSGWLAWKSPADNLAAVVLPIYNTRPIADILTSVTDPMGLCTKPSYRTLTDPSVYAPGSLSTSSPTDPKSSYIIKGSTRYVVSQYSCTNDPARNSLPTAYSIRKFYEGARMDLTGRGWQGFRRVWTQCISEPSPLIVEMFAQAWPLTHSKIQEDTYDQGFSSTNQSATATPQLDPSSLLKSTVVTWKTFPLPLLAATTYRTRVHSKEISMFDAGVFQNGLITVYGYNKRGLKETEKVYTKDTSTTQGPFHTGTFTAYQDLNIAINVPKTIKTTTKEQNLDSMDFLEGDMDLSEYKYDTQKQYIYKIDRWSECNKKFISSSFQRDTYGNTTQTINSSGLTVNTTYDPIFQTYPVSTSESGPGITQTLIKRYAYDTRFGLKVVETEYNGCIKSLDLDAFGRTIATGITALPGDQPSSILSMPVYVMADETFKTKISKQSLVVNSTFNFNRLSDGTGSWISSVEQNFGQVADTSTAVVKSTYFDSRSMNRQSYVKEGTNMASWVWRKYDQRGNVIVESIPVAQPDISNPIPILKSQPANDDCTFKSYDMLGRQLLETKPMPAAGEDQLRTETQYTDGGYTVVMKSYGLKSGTSIPSTPPLSITTVKHVVKGGQVKVWKSTNELGWETVYSYNDAGHLMQIIDQGGQPDVTHHNLQGTLMYTDNVYENPGKNPAGAKVYQYYDSGQVQSETNAMGETITYEYDAKGRILKRAGFDGRNIVYQYDTAPNGIGSAANVTVYSPNSQNIESSVDFAYNLRGLPSTVTRNAVYKVGGVSKQHSWPIQIEYNLLGKVTSQQLSDDLSWDIHFNGALTSKSALSFSKDKQMIWEIANQAVSYDAFENCTQWGLTSSGGLSMAVANCNLHYDNVNACRTREYTISSTPFVNESYTYDALGLRKTKQDWQTQKTLQYQYMGRRLAQVQDASETTAFHYYSSGNLKGKNGMDFQYTANGATGTLNGKVALDVAYDNCGRMTSRTYNGQTFTFKYNSFNHVSEQTNMATQQTVFFYDDHTGKRLFSVRPDGYVRVQVTPCWVGTVDSTGSVTAEFHLPGPGGIAAAVAIPLADPASATVKPMYADWKGTVTHIFNQNGKIDRVLEYDDFGMLLSGQSQPLSAQDSSMTYESREMQYDTGLLEFGARCYDPVLGRFTTPDTQLSNDPLTVPDVLNRLCFENNDPINVMDPTGHFSVWAGLGIGLGVVLIAASIGLTIMTAGLASPLIIAAAAGFLSGAGFAGVSYSITHRDQDNFEDFALGYLENAAIGGVAGAILGPAGKFLSVLSFAATAAEGTATVAIEAATTDAIVSATRATTESVGESALESTGAQAGESAGISINGSIPSDVALRMTARALVGSGVGTVQQLFTNYVQHQPLTTNLAWAAGMGGLFSATGSLLSDATGAPKDASIPTKRLYALASGSAGAGNSATKQTAGILHTMLTAKAAPIIHPAIHPNHQMLLTPQAAPWYQPVYF